MARKLAFDRWLFIIPLGLTLFGLLMVYSASSVLSIEEYGNPYHYLLRQTMAAGIGIATMVALMFTPYPLYQNRWLSGSLFALSVVMLIAVLGMPAIQGVHRWIRIGGFNLQPSEIAKLSAILFLAGFLDRQRARLRQFSRTLLPALAAIGQLAVLIVLEPDLGTAVILVGTSIGLLFMSGIPYRQLAALVVVCVLAGGCLAISADYRMQRLIAFMHPDRDPQGAGFQAIQSLLAISSGGVGGRSLGEGQQKHFFLPAPHTDFIFSVIAEETGLTGASAVVAAFALLVWRGLRTAARVPDRFAALLATGLVLSLGLEALVNIGVALALLPTKGLPLPFISYGGSSLVCSLAGVGILLNISQHSS